LLVTEPVVFPVMSSAQRHRELVADLEPHTPRLSEPQVMGIRRVSTANQARMRCHEFEVGFVAITALLAYGKYAFIDFCETRLSFASFRSRRIVVDNGL